MSNHSVLYADWKSIHDLPCSLIPVFKRLQLLWSWLFGYSWGCLMFALNVVPISFSHKEICDTEPPCMKVVFIQLLLHNLVDAITGHICCRSENADNLQSVWIILHQIRANNIPTVCLHTRDTSVYCTYTCDRPAHLKNARFCNFLSAYLQTAVSCNPCIWLLQTETSDWAEFCDLQDPVSVRVLNEPLTSCSAKFPPERLRIPPARRWLVNPRLVLKS